MPIRRRLPVCTTWLIRGLKQKVFEVRRIQVAGFELGYALRLRCAFGFYVAERERLRRIDFKRYPAADVVFALG